MPVITPWDPNFWEPLDTTGVELVEFQDKMIIYPVPTHGPLFISFDLDDTDREQDMEIRVYSMTGRLVLRKEYQNSSLVELSLQDQPAGLYLLRLQIDGDIIERRVVRY